MRGLRDRGYAYGLYSFLSGWQAITGSWRLPGVPVWAASGTLDYPNEARDKCVQPSFSGGRVYLSQWLNDARTLDYDLTCEPYAFTSFPAPPATLSNSTADFNGDWKNDVLARWTTTASLRLYAGTGSGTLGLGTQIGTGWGGMSLLETPGDLSGDGAHDVLARETATGYLWLYKGNGAGGWRLPRVGLGAGWGAMNAIVGIGDLSGDERPDIVARQTSTGQLWLYPGTGASGWKPRVLVGTGWNAYSAVVGAGDLTGDGAPRPAGPRARHGLPVAGARHLERRARHAGAHRHRVELDDRDPQPRRPQQRPRARRPGPRQHRAALALPPHGNRGLAPAQPRQHGVEHHQRHLLSADHVDTQSGPPPSRVTGRSDVRIRTDQTSAGASTASAASLLSPSAVTAARLSLPRGSISLSSTWTFWPTLEDVLDAVDALAADELAHLGDVQQAVLAGQQRDERTEGRRS